MTDVEIIEAAKNLIKEQYMVELKYLINTKHKLNYDMNKIESLACRLTKGIKYVRFEGHDKDGVFIRKVPEYELKLASFIIAFGGLISAIIKYIISC